MSQQHLCMNGSTAKTVFNGRNFITFCDSSTSSKPSMRKEKTSSKNYMYLFQAVCKSKKSWQARHTGIKIIQQIAILMGCAILPHLRSLVEIIEHGLVDDQQKVRTITALGLAALAEAATPYGIESFDSVLKPLWKGTQFSSILDIADLEFYIICSQYRYSHAQRQRSCCLSESHWVLDSPHGRRICKLLHQGGEQFVRLSHFNV